MKKLLAIILAISMCISLLPGFAYATGEATNEGAITYNFNSASYGASASVKNGVIKMNTTGIASGGYTTDNSVLPDGYDIDALNEKADARLYTIARLDYNEVFASINTAPWRIDGHYNINPNDPLSINSDHLSFGKAASEVQQGHVAFVIKIEKPGTYKPTIAYGENKRGAKFDVHLVKKNTDEGYGIFSSTSAAKGTSALYNDLSTYEDTYKIGYINMYHKDYDFGASKCNKTTEDLDVITITETGEYYLLFEHNGTDGVGTDGSANPATYTYLYSLSLEPQKVYDYNFNYSTYGATDVISKNTATANGGPDADKVKLENGYEEGVTLTRLDYSEVFAENNTTPWRIDGHRNLDTLVLEDDCISATIKNASINASVPSGHLALIINIEKAGTYIPTLSFGATERGAKYDVHLVKKNEDRGYGIIVDSKTSVDATGETALSTDLTAYGDTYKIGAVNMYEEGTNYGKPIVTDKELAPITIDESDVGEYYLLLEATGAEVVLTGAPKYYTYLYSLNLTDAELLLDYDADFNADEDPLAAYGAEVTTAAVATDGAVIENNTSESDDDGDGIYTISTEKTVGDYSFLYWAKGLSADKKNKVVSDALSFDYKPTEGNNWLIAVYAKEDSETASAEFYDANRQLLYSTDSGTVTVTDSTITIPALPSHPGLGQATHWELAGDEETEYGVGENTTAEFSGTMIFVAQYDNGVETVTVNGTEYDYGTPVTCTANTPEGKTFKGWIKNVNGKNELVSTSSVYKFLAWEDCRVEPIYSDDAESFGSAMKIVLDDFAVGNGTAIMAEFIGIENVVEKGIMFGTTKIAMTGDGNQFTITADEAGTYTGYAIVEDNGTYTEITDGEVVID